MLSHMPARRRRWQAALIITLFFTAVAGAAAIGWWYARESPPHQGPIVVILVDGMPASALPDEEDGAGSGAIAALAADGVVFDRAYTHATEMLPATASLLSGQLPFEHHVRGDAGFTLGSGTRTLAELLRGRGFSTGAALSSFLLRRESGIAQGFSFFDAEISPTSEDGALAIARSGADTLDAAEQWARAQGGQRYFLFVQVSDRDGEMAVSRLVQLLKARGLYDRSTIVFVSTRGATDAAAALDDATLHIPLIVKQPSREGAGRHVSWPVQQADLLPTLLDLVRAPMPGGIHGRSLRPLLDSDAVIPSQPIYSESLSAYFRFGGQPVYAVTGARLRLVRDADDRIVPIATDVEPADVRVTPASDEATLRAAIERFVGTRDIDAPAPIRPADADALAAAGYLGGMAPATASDLTLDAQQARAIEKAHREAAVQIAAGRLGDAGRILQGITARHPALAMVHFQLGSLLARMGHVDAAIAAFDRAGALRPDAVDVPLAKAEVLLDAARLEEAQETAAAVLADEEPHDAYARAAAHAIAARVALGRHDAEAAAMHAEAVQAADPALPARAFVSGRLLYDAAEYEDAVAAFDEAAATLQAQTTIMPGVHFYLGESLSHLERYADAEAAFLQERHDYPHHIPAYASLALLYHASNRPEDMAAILEALVEAAPTPAGYAAAARLWTMVGERARAEALRSDARTRFQDDPGAVSTGRDGHR